MTLPTGDAVREVLVYVRARNADPPGNEPEGPTMPMIERVIPLLIYEDIPVAHDFLVKAFGFDSGGVERNAEGQAIHAEVRAGDTTIWLHRVTAAHGLNSPRATAMASSGLVVHVDDVDAHHE